MRRILVAGLLGLLATTGAARAGSLAARGTWGDHLNPGGEVPTGRFRAFYISTDEPRRVRGTAEMDEIQVNYSWSDLHGIDSEKFGAYFAGRLVFPEATAHEISLALGHAEARLVIDGHEVAKVTSNEVLTYQFPAGEHLVEVEYLNHWHTTEFRVAMEPVRRTYTLAQARRALDEILEGDEEVWYVGVYEAEAPDAVLPVTLVSSGRPLVLVLSSYSALTWDLTGNPGVGVRAVVYGAYDPGAKVRLPPAWRDVPCLRVEDLPQEDSLEPSYERHGTYFHVETEGIRAVTEGLEALTGRRPDTFTGEYGPTRLRAPGTILDEAAWARIAEAYAAMERARRDGPRGVGDLFDDR